MYENRVIHHYDVDLLDGYGRVADTRTFEPDELDEARRFAREHANRRHGSSPTTVFADADGEPRAEMAGLLRGRDYRDLEYRP